MESVAWQVRCNKLEILSLGFSQGFYSVHLALTCPVCTPLVSFARF